MHEPATDTAAVPPRMQLIKLTTAAWPGGALHAGAGFGLADHRADVPGGQERTETEYRARPGKPGFWLTRVMPTASAVSVVEAVMV